MDSLPVIAYPELKERLSDIPTTEEFLKARALFSTVYASLGRVGEIVRGRYKKTPSIKKRDIVVNPNGVHVDFHIRTEKVNIDRTVAVNRDLEPWLINPILQHSMGFDPDEELFPYSTRWAEKRFQKFFPEYGQHIHLMRKWRATHLLQGHGTRQRLTINEVARMGGWTKLDALNRAYNYTVIEDYREMI